MLQSSLRSISLDVSHRIGYWRPEVLKTSNFQIQLKQISIFLSNGISTLKHLNFMA